MEPRPHHKDAQVKDSPSLSCTVSDSSSSLASQAVTESVTSSPAAAAMPPAPDGGWGWFVLLGAFIINVIVGGTSFSFGVIYVHLLAEFQQSKSATAWVASIFYCISLLLGPVASSLTVRFGLRKVTMAAGLVSTAGFLASAFAPSLWTLYFTFSVVVGAGFAVCDVTASVAVAFYFQKRRALATGLSECGTGVGTFAFAPLCEVLVDAYGWRGTFMLLGGVALHIVICGALFRPPAFTLAQRRLRALDAFDRLTRLDPAAASGAAGDAVFAWDTAVGWDGSNARKAAITRTCSQVALPTFCAEVDGKLSASYSGLPQPLDRFARKPQVVFLKHPIVKTQAYLNGSHTGHRVDSVAVRTALNSCSSFETRLDNGQGRTQRFEWTKGQKHRSEYVSLDDVHEFSTSGASDNCFNESFRCVLLKSGESKSSIQVQTVEFDTSEKAPSMMANGGMEMMPHVQPSGGRSDLRWPFNSRRLSTYLLLRREVIFRASPGSSPGHVSASCPELHHLQAECRSETSSSQKHVLCLSRVREVFRSAFDKEILQHPSFVLFTVSNFLMYFWGDVPYLFATDFAISRGVPGTEATLLISIIGIVNTAGQVIYGLIGDSGCNLTVVFGLSAVGSGVVVVLLSLAQSYWFMAVLCGLYGFFDAACYALITTMLVSYVGLDKLPHAYGLVMMGKGLANLGGPPVAGWLTDETNYTVAFSVGGTIIVLAGVILFPSYVVALCRRARLGCRSGRARRRGETDVITWQDAGCGKPLVKEKGKRTAV